MTSPPFLAADMLGVPHGFFGRRGGVSTGAMASLQCGLGADDDRDAVAENRRRAAGAVLPGASLSGLHQVHGIEVVTIDAPIADSARPKADALVTAVPGLGLGIVTADCAPLLLADAKAGVVGAAHAGWKGALAGVGAATVAAMVALGARRERITAAIGPAIAQASYEVDAAFVARFQEADPANERFFAAGRPGHHQFDLEGYNAMRLARAGVTRIACLGQDTYAAPDEYYSYRRATHRGEADYGRQLSVIGLNG
ncbi:MAG: peptidoglycan editing factor PgeF [Pseudomonadota bacterium]